MSLERASSDFGRRLRDARERRGVSLRQIANATKISVSVLEALERNDISKLPGGIFGRAFVRSYASEVGLDPDATIQDFTAQFPSDSVVGGDRGTDRGEDHVSGGAGRRTAGTVLSLLAIGVPIAAGLLYFAIGGRQSPAQPPPFVASAAAEQPGPSFPAGAAQPPARVAEIVPATATPATVDTRPAVTTTGDPLTVGLKATGPCWISATVDGRKTLERLLQKGEQQTLTVRRELILTAGDASAIALQFNGEDARALGKAGEVVTARFNLTNYKDYLQAR